MRLKTPVVMGVLAFAGLADSIYLTLVHYGFANIESSPASTMCEIARGSCDIVSKSSSYSLLGIPSSLLGTAYFILVAAFITASIINRRWIAPRIMLGIFVAGLFFSVYLIYVMFYVLKTPCPFCILAHIINVTILFLYGHSLYKHAGSTN